MMRFFVHWYGRSYTNRLKATGGTAAGDEADRSMLSGMVCRAILSAAGLRAS